MKCDLFIDGTKTQRRKVELDLPTPQDPLDRLLRSELCDLGFSTRAAKVFDLNGIEVLADLVAKKESEIERMKNMGPVCLAEIRQTLAGLGLRLAQ